jgi:hypothetical protein
MCVFQERLLLDNLYKLKCKRPFVTMNATPKVLHRLLLNLDTTFHSNPRVFLSIYDIAIWRGNGGAWYTLWQFFTDCFALWTKRCVPLRKCVHTHTHKQLRGKRWSHKHRWFKHVHLRKFGTHRFEILKQRCILIRASVHVRAKSISGWEVVEPQSRKLLHRLVSNFDTPLHSNMRVFIYRMGCDATAWYGTALSHSDAWPGTASW